VGTPVVALFGPTSRAWGFYPSGPFDAVLERALGCRPCSLHGTTTCRNGRECLTAIEPEEVAARLFDTLERAAGPVAVAP
jgi:ADP-heptose:LPS heptosyltransferase